MPQGNSYLIKKSFGLDMSDVMLNDEGDSKNANIKITNMLMYKMLNLINKRFKYIQIHYINN